MKILKQFFSVLFVLLCVVGTGYAATFDGVRELVSRRAPWLGKHIQFKEIASSDGDCFILQTVGKKLVVQATGANAAAVGVNWYLKYYCHRSMSHLGDQLAPVTELPVIGQPVTVKTTSIYRYALNYCTFNYTMSFYDWDDWQWELDWMALNGVNLMLVANGSEAVWQNTLRRMNYSEKEIADFFDSETVVQESKFFLDDTMLLAALRDGTIELYCVKEKLKKYSRKILDLWPTDIAKFSEDTALISTREGMIIVFDVVNKEIIGEISFASGGGIASMEKDDKFLYIGFASGELYVVDIMARYDEFSTHFAIKDFEKCDELARANIFLTYDTEYKKALAESWEGQKVKVSALLSKNDIVLSFSILN